MQAQSVWATVCVVLALLLGGLAVGGTTFAVVDCWMQRRRERRAAATYLVAGRALVHAALPSSDKAAQFSEGWPSGKAAGC